MRVPVHRHPHRPGRARLRRRPDVRSAWSHACNGGGNTLTDSPSLAGAMGRAASAGPGRHPVTDTESIAIVPPARPAGGGSAVADFVVSPTLRAVAADDPGDWLTLTPLSGSSPAAAPSGLTAPWKPAQPIGGGAAMAPRGGSGGGAQAAVSAMLRGQSPLPAAPSTPSPPRNDPRRARAAGPRPARPRTSPPRSSPATPRRRPSLAADRAPPRRRQ